MTTTMNLHNYRSVRVHLPLEIGGGRGSDGLSPFFVLLTWWRQQNSPDSKAKNEHKFMTFWPMHWKFCLFLLKIGGEFISQSWLIYTPFSQLSHSAMVTVVTMVECGVKHLLSWPSSPGLSPPPRLFPQNGSLNFHSFIYWTKCKRLPSWQSFIVFNIPTPYYLWQSFPTPKKNMQHLVSFL